MTKTVARLTIYPLLLVVAWWLFLKPVNDQQIDGYYPATPAVAEIQGGQQYGQWLVPAVLEKPVSAGANAVHNVMYSSRWNPDSQYYTGRISPQEAGQIVQQWRASRDAAYNLTGKQTPLTWLQPENAIGSSFGLTAALASIDALGAGLLTGNQSAIAATGVVTSAGTVHSIGGVAAKLIGVQSTDAQIFFVPADNYHLIPADTGNVTVVPVTTVAEAINYLCTCHELQVTDSICNQ
jgi:hypothetical protein